MGAGSYRDKDRAELDIYAKFSRMVYPAIRIVSQCRIDPPDDLIPHAADAGRDYIR